MKKLKRMWKWITLRSRLSESWDLRCRGVFNGLWLADTFTGLSERGQKMLKRYQKHQVWYARLARRMPPFKTPPLNKTWRRSL